MSHPPISNLFINEYYIMRWTKDEELNFIKGISEGRSMDDLSVVHDRTPSALELRLKKIIYDNVSKGRTTKSLSRLLNMSRDKILQYHFSYADWREKNGKPAKKIDIDAEQSGGGKREKDKSKKRKKKREKREKTKKKRRKHKKKRDRQSGGNVDDKIKELDDQNRLFETIIKNNSMKEQIRAMYKDKNIDDSIRKIIRIIKDQGLV